MKRLLNKLLYSRITSWGFLAVLLVAAGATVAWMDQGQHKFGGAWIGGNGEGSIWNALQIPKNPTGLTCGVRVNTTMYGESFAGLLTAFGADSTTEAVGEMEMISHDTAKYGMVFYLQQQGNPPTLRAIAVMTGTLQFTGPDNFFVDYIIDVYPASADSDLDGYPDPGAVPAATIPGLDLAKRVPIP